MDNLEIINPESNLNFGISIPKPFVLSEMPKAALDKIVQEVMDKVTTWENRMSPFFEVYFKGADSWRIRPKSKNPNKKGLFNSKSGETHRATETLATVWTRMLTASDPYFQAVAEGLSTSGFPITEEELYATEAVLIKQQRAARFKKKILKVARSLGLMGTVVVEEPYISLPYGFGRKYIEFTDIVFRPMIRTGFDTAVCDINDSDFIFFIDFVSKWMLRNQASLAEDHWDMGKVEKHIEEFGSGNSGSNSGTYSRLQQSRSRAGYYDIDAKVFENINYHGRLEPNEVIDRYAESVGLEEDPKFVDWSVGILDGTSVAKFHMTQYGDWHTRAKVVTYKDFEDEPLGYGIAQTGRKLQRQLDISESLMDDRFIFDILNMMKIGKYSGYDSKQFVAEPMKMIELEDVNQLVPLVGDPRVLTEALNMIALRREDFRNIVGAQTNLQAAKTSSNSATEAALSQTEAIRAASVHAEVIAETLLREHLETSHLNNLNYLDEPIWVAMTGSKKPVLVDKTMLPPNVGFEIKVVTDKDFKPERVRNLLQLFQIIISGSNFMPSTINVLRPVLKEIFRAFEVNPALLNEDVPIADQLEMKAAKLANAGRIPAQLEAEAQGDASGGGANMSQTPIGPVPTSPNGASYPMEMSA